MVAGSESVPSNYEVISTTADTSKPALKNNLRIIYRRLPLVQTSAVISDIAIYDQKSNLPQRWQCISIINNMQLVVKQMSKREIESQNNKNTENQLDTTSLLQKSQFRSAKTRSQKSYSEFSGYPTNTTLPQSVAVGVGSIPNRSQNSMTAGTSARAFNSQTSVSKISPIDGLEFTVSKKIQQKTPGTNSFESEEFTSHESSELVDFDFGQEFAILNN